MNKEAASIFEQSGCPSTRQLIDYLEGKLPPEQVHRVEAHLAGCAFCSEALEGFQQMEHKEQIPVIVKQIQGQLRRELEGHRSRKRRKKRYVWLSALIFIILIIILVAYFALYFVMRRERSDAARRQAPTTWVIPEAGTGARAREAEAWRPCHGPAPVHSGKDLWGPGEGRRPGCHASGVRPA